MPASLPGSTLVENLANPTAGHAVLLDALSGPKGSPLDVRRITGWANGSPTYASDAANQTPSTGAMSTGIGFGCNNAIGISPGTSPATAAQALKDAGFTDDSGIGFGDADSTRVYIGGGRHTAPTLAAPSGAANPYTAGFAACVAGNGGERDAAGPTGHAGKWVTAAGAVANGAAVEVGFNNISGGALVADQSVIGAEVAAQAVPA